jgi:hypothetical protein
MKYCAFRMGFCLAVLLRYSCSNYVYSPSVLLAKDPLAQGAFDIKAGAGKLPKVNPFKPYSTESGLLEVGYGVTNKMSLYLSGWSDFGTSPFFYKAGTSLSSRISLWSNDRAQLIVYPKVAVLKDGEKFDAMGFELSMLYLWNMSEKWYAYLGLAGAGGNRGLRMHHSSSEQLFGGIGHLGFGYQATSYLRIMLEVNPIYQYNYYFEKGNFLVSPTFSIGYTIGMPANTQSKFQSKKRKKVQ